jgi:hypothetical protein
MRISAPEELLRDHLKLCLGIRLTQASSAMDEWRRARTFRINRKRRGADRQVQAMNSAIAVYWHAAAAQTKT